MNDSSQPVMKPWFAWNEYGWLLCLMGRTSKPTGKQSAGHFLGIKWSKASAAKRTKWLKTHHR